MNGWLNRTNLLWLTAYVVMLVLVVVSVDRARHSALAIYSTPQAQAEWKAYLETEREKQKAGGPVKRRLPKTEVPPPLVLMRDHFPVVMTAAVVFSSLLFLTLMVALRGSWRRPPQRRKVRQI